MTDSRTSKELLALSVENTARWLEKGCDPQHAAGELRIIATKLRADEPSATLAERIRAAVTWEPFEEWTRTQGELDLTKDDCTKAFGRTYQNDKTEYAWRGWAQGRCDLLKRAPEPPSASPLPRVIVHDEHDIRVKTGDPCWTALSVGGHAHAILVVTRMEDGDDVPQGRQIIDALVKLGAPVTKDASHE